MPGYHYPIRYVYSMRLPGAVAHIGNPDRALCGIVLHGFYENRAQYPAGRALCPECAVAAGARRESVIRVHSWLAARDALLVALLRDGLANAGIARRLNLTRRLIARYVEEAMWRAQAATRFQFGYNVGYAQGVRDGVRYAVVRGGAGAAPAVLAPAVGSD